MRNSYEVYFNIQYTLYGKYIKFFDSLLCKWHFNLLKHQRRNSKRIHNVYRVSIFVNYVKIILFRNAVTRNWEKKNLQYVHTYVMLYKT